MTRKTWQIHLDGKTYGLEVRHGYWSGKREIWLDGQLIAAGKQLLDAGSAHSFNIGGHDSELLILSRGLSFRFLLLVDGVAHLSEEDANKGKTPDRFMERILSTNTFWSDIARYANLKPFDVPDAHGMWRKRLIGTIRGYPVMLSYGMSIRPPREFILVWVLYAAIYQFSNTANSLAQDEKIKNLLGEAPPKERLFGEQNAWVTFPYRPQKESGLDVAIRLEKLITLISNHVAPPDLRHCGNNLCTGPQGEIHLAFVDGNPVLLCSACAADSATWSDKAKQAYHDAPSRLLQGALVGLGIAILGSVLWAALAITLGGIAAFTSLAALIASVTAIDRVKTKPTFTIPLAVIVACGSEFLGCYLTVVWKLLRQAPQPHQGIALGDLLANAGTLMRNSELWTMTMFFAIFIAIYSLSFWFERRSKVRRSLEPHIEIVDASVTAELLRTGHSIATATMPDHLTYDS